ncbi:dsRBD fold-containing protein [Kutzneria sp. 744]
MPEIGDELAVARALADLSHQLLDAAVQDVEGITHRPAHFAE